MKKLIIALVSLSLLASCGPTLKSRSASRIIYIENQAISQHPTIAEVHVDTKSPIHYTAENVKEFEAFGRKKNKRGRSTKATL